MRCEGEGVQMARRVDAASRIPVLLPRSAQAVALLKHGDGGSVSRELASSGKTGHAGTNDQCSERLSVGFGGRRCGRSNETHVCGHHLAVLERHTFAHTRRNHLSHEIGPGCWYHWSNSVEPRNESRGCRLADRGCSLLVESPGAIVADANDRARRELRAQPRAVPC